MTGITNLPDITAMKKNYILLIILSAFGLTFAATDSGSTESTELSKTERITARDFPSVLPI